MAAVQTLALPHLSHAPVHVALFQHVRNAAFLRQQLLAGNQAFEYAFLDATALLSTTHVLAAVFRALNDQLNGRLRSRNVHSEIVFSLSPNNNIADSFRRFGVQDTTTALLAIKVPTDGHPLSAAQVQAHLSESVEGTAVPFTDDSLAEFSDLARIRKTYKLDAALPSQKGKNPPKKRKQPNGVAHLNGSATDEAPPSPSDDRKEMEVCILGIMALKGS
ncbi:putative zinc finger ccch-type protein [Diplodia seriata]|uniref:EKC/KEOPS complex subunit CGI121 n=1 Tax=Diplodia seriata TaxID=420778 RepID=A0A0G2G6W6_9PEZI|nr:putative zinc finger ccch-type protein [Diplodia seriata]